MIKSTKKKNKKNRTVLFVLGHIIQFTIQKFDVKQFKKKKTKINKKLVFTYALKLLHKRKLSNDKRKTEKSL